MSVGRSVLSAGYSTQVAGGSRLHPASRRARRLAINHRVFDEFDIGLLENLQPLGRFAGDGVSEQPRFGGPEQAQALAVDAGERVITQNIVATLVERSAVTVATAECVIFVHV